MSRPKPAHRINRRQALAGMAAAGAAAGCRTGWRPPEDEPTSLAHAKPYVPGAETYGIHEERWFTTSCAQCPASCGIRVRVVEGRAVRVEGYRDNPVNQGGIGPRGLASLQGLYDADRITEPLVRDGDRLVPIGWDQALDRLAAALAELRAGGHPERLLVWCGHERGLMRDLLHRFATAFGTPNFVDGRPGRRGALMQAMKAAVGSDELPVYDWPRVRTVLSLEAALVEDSCQSVYFTRVTAGLHRGDHARGRLIHAGPMLDLCAHSADEWLRIRPGTAGALALGLCHVLMKRYPEETTIPSSQVEGEVDVASFKAFIDSYPPGVVEVITGLPVADLERIAEQLWNERPAIALVDERSLAYSNGFDTARAAIALNTVLGGFWDPPITIRTAPELPLTDWPTVTADDIASAGLARRRLDRADEFPHADSVHETLPEAIAAAGEDRPRVALLFHANPAYARQQPARWRRALASIDTVVSFSPYRDETVETVADLVLPDHTFLERWEVTVPAPALDRAVAGLRVPVIEPLHRTRAAGDVVVDLAHRVGAPLADAFPWEGYRDATEARLQGIADLHRGNVTATSTRELLGHMHPIGFWVDDQPTAHAVERVTLHTDYTAPAWHGDDADYPLGLIAYRPLGYAEGGGANLPWLRSLRPRPGAIAWTFAARIHPSSAAGWSDGAVARIESAWGAIELPLQLDEWIEPGYIAVPMGGGHAGWGRWARYGANVLDVVAPEPAPGTGAALLCATRVRLSPRDGGAA